MDDDLHALRQLKDGRIGGLEFLVLKYQVRAARTAFLITRDAQLAEDIVQDTFLRIYRYINRFDESRPFAPYLMRSIVNAALDTVTNAGQEAILDFQSLEDQVTMIEYAASVESQVEFSSQKEELNRALEQLSPNQRATLVMRYYLGMSESEMSEELHIARGTVKWLLHAARTRMRRLLGERSTK